MWINRSLTFCANDHQRDGFWEARMADKRTAPTERGLDATQFLQFGKVRTDAMFNIQKELLDAYAELSRSWAARVKSEVNFWSDLAAKLSNTHSAPEGLGAYRQYVSQRMQMAADDGQRLLSDSQRIMGALAQALPNGLHGPKLK
jgi:hypothetical protein